MSNLDLRRKDDVSSFRKIAIGTWQNAYDPQVYGTIELRMDQAMKYLAEYRRATGKKLTISHMMAKAVAMVLHQIPEVNAVLRWNRVYLRQRIGVFFQVVMTDEGLGKADLSGVTLYDIERKSLAEIYDEFCAKVELVRARRDPALEKTRATMRGVPYFLLNALLKVLSFLTYTLNLDLSALGVPKDPFGSAMITNVGSLGLDTAYAPLVPYSHVPMVLAVGAVRQEPVVDDGQLAVGQVMRVNATFDHRLIDGLHASLMTKIIRACFEQPYEHFGPPPANAAAAPVAASHDEKR